MLVRKLYPAVCLAVTLGILLFGSPEFSVCVYIAAVMVAVLGVPHGGLDHWTGRRLLVGRFEDRWWLVFFPSYLAVCVAVGIAWFALPIPTVISFFLLSAWHFGRGDQEQPFKPETIGSAKFVFRNLRALALGGLVIWIPALFRPQEMESVLAAIVPGSNGSDPEQIIRITRWIAIGMCGLVLVYWSNRIVAQAWDSLDWMSLATAVLALSVPILISFSVYFCLWHSVTGLLRLREQERLSAGRFAIAIAPMSVLAVAGVLVSLSWVQQSIGFSTSSPISASLQTLFIGLSAIAVPHVLLHELADIADRNSSPKTIPC